MADSKGTMNHKILRTQRRILGWASFFWNLIVLAVALGVLFLWHLQEYAGGWALLDTIRLQQWELRWLEPDFVFQLTLQARGMAPMVRDVTGELTVLVVSLLVVNLLEGLVAWICGLVWRWRISREMHRLTLLAQEASRIGAQESRRTARQPRMDDLRDAIGHISPTESTRLHTGDPDLRGLENAINDLLDRMQNAYSQQTRFVSDASHELRTPIAVLKGYADLLERWGKNDPQVRDESIAAIQREAERMSRLVEQLLFLARGDSGRTQLQLRDLDLAELTRQVWEESRMIDGDHVWELDAPEPIPYRGDRDMLQQALRILSDNAAKYTPAGGTILLRTGVREGKPILEVRDQGIGIKTGDAAHVFDRFYRSDPARSRQSGGAGLGLSIADWIVSRHGGHITVYSWEGVGSRFTIFLGCAEET